MFEMYMTPQHDKIIGLMPTEQTIALAERNFPYLQMDLVTIANPLTAVHSKVLAGFYEGNISSIRARVHYPHMAGEAWTRGISPEIYAYTGAAVTCDAFPEGNHTVGGYRNNSAFKERTFWGGTNDYVTEDEKLVPGSMYYTTAGIGLLRPDPSDPDYYADSTGAGYPHGASPSAWVAGSVISTTKRWSVSLNMNQFWCVGGKNYWTAPFDYDPRMQLIEFEITGTYQGDPIVGSRLYYVWHMPQCFAIPTTVREVVTNGEYSGPFGGQACGGIGCQYTTGFTASGGDGYIYNDGNSIDYENILLEADTQMFNASSPSEWVSLPVSIYITAQISNIYAVVNGVDFDPTDSGTYDYMEELGKGNLQLDGDWIGSVDFLDYPASFPEGENYYLYFKLNFTSYKFGSGAVHHTYFYNFGSCTPPTVGTYRYYYWCVIVPSCSQFCFGASFDPCYTGMTQYDGWLASGSYIVGMALDDIETGTNLDTVTAQLIIGGITLRTKCVGNDGKTPFWIYHYEAGDKKGYNNYNDVYVLPINGVRDNLVWGEAYTGSDEAYISQEHLKVVNYKEVDGSHSAIKAFGQVNAERVEV